MRSSDEHNIDILCFVMNLSRIEFTELALDIAERFIFQYTTDRELARSIFLSREFWYKWDFHFRHANAFFIARHGLRNIHTKLQFEKVQYLRRQFEALHSPEKIKIDMNKELLEEAEMRTIERMFTEGKSHNDLSRKSDPL